MESLIIIGAMAAAATAIIKIHDRNARSEFEERKAAVLAVAEEQIARNRSNREHPQSADPDPDADKFIQALIEAARKREEEQKKLRKWQHYAKHAKKRRIRKKYQKKLREYETKKWKPIGIIGGNWPYGSGTELFRGIENPWPSAGSDYYYGRHPGGGIWNTPGLRGSPWIPFNGPAAPIFKPEGGKNYD